MLYRTDLALEARELFRNEGGGEEIPGVECRTRRRDGFDISTVRVVDEEGSGALCKPVGTYVTIQTLPLVRREDGAFAKAAEVLAAELRELITVPGSVLVAGLGNAAITPDAVGRLTLESIIVTRQFFGGKHNGFGFSRAVSAIEPGVLGTTGVDSADIIAAVCRKIRPALVIAVDALASRQMERLCTTVQIADTGIVPGSGVGNSRPAINEDTVGVPVISVGVPTVIDAATLAADMVSGVAGTAPSEEDLRRSVGPLIVTPRDIDARVRDMSRLLGYGIDLALHDGLTVADVDMLL